MRLLRVGNWQVGKLASSKMAGPSVAGTRFCAFFLRACDSSCDALSIAVTILTFSLRAAGTTSKGLSVWNAVAKVELVLQVA